MLHLIIKAKACALADESMETVIDNPVIELIDFQLALAAQLVLEVMQSSPGVLHAGMQAQVDPSFIIVVEEYGMVKSRIVSERGDGDVYILHLVYLPFSPSGVIIV